MRKIYQRKIETTEQDATFVKIKYLQLDNNILMLSNVNLYTIRMSQKNLTNDKLKMNTS